MTVETKNLKLGKFIENMRLEPSLPPRASMAEKCEQTARYMEHVDSFRKFNKFSSSASHDNLFSFRYVLERFFTAPSPQSNIPGSATIEIEKTMDGIPMSKFYGKDMSPLGTEINGFDVVTTLFRSIDMLVSGYPSPLEKREMVVEKQTFLDRLEKERGELAAVIQQGNSPTLYPDLLKTMEAMSTLVRGTNFYEINLPPENGIPAFFIGEGSNKGLNFTKGSFNFSLAFHEMAHRVQWENQDRHYLSHSDSVMRHFDARDTNNKEVYLWREEEVYQWNVAYTFFKMGFSAYHFNYLPEVLEKFKKYTMPEDNTQFPRIKTRECEMVNATVVTVYALVQILRDEIGKITDFSQEEKASAEALVFAYFNVSVCDDKKLQVKTGELPRVLGKFYHAYLNQQ